MSRHKSTPKLTPIWLPYIRDKLADWKNDLGRRTAIASGQPLDDSWRIGEPLRSSPIWWVSRDMATLAAETAEAGDLPDVRPPSVTGFMVFQDGLPFRLQDYPDGRSCSVDAIEWTVTPIGQTGTALVTEVFSKESAFVGECDPRLPLGYVTFAHGSRPGILEGVLKAAWALSQQPSISDTRAPRVTPLDRVPARYEQTEITRVRMLLLRENLHRPGEQAEPGEKTREYSHRWIVRGFWREQPYGKGHALRRRQWIPPFVKGPADKPLIRKKTVHILR